MDRTAILSNIVERCEKAGQEIHGMPVLLVMPEPFFDIRTDVPGMIGRICAIEVDPKLVKGNILDLEVAPFPEEIPWY